MSAQLATFEEDRKQYQEQLDIVLLSLKDDPDNAELLGLKAELDDMITLIDESIAELKPERSDAPPPPKPEPKKTAAAPPAPPPPPTTTEEKWSRENHPAFKKAAQASPPPPPPAAEEKEDVAVTYQVNDTVLAKWVSGDKGFYPARITSITGPPTARMYTARFKSYDTVETLRAHEIRPIAQKRKAPDGAGGAATPQPGPSFSAAPGAVAGGSSSNGVVTSAAASMYPQAQLGAGEGGADGGAARKPKKIKANKELEAGKNKWQDFNSKSKFGKNKKKDSMFRTPEGVHGRVGFTGSGQAMRKDPTRSRHIYQQNDELD